jgi:predicted nucleotidyltransferase
MSTYGITDIQKIQLAEAGVILCYVHGSAASGTQRVDSDIDIAVLYAIRPADMLRAELLIANILSPLANGRELDVVILNDAGAVLTQAVASRGVIIYERSADDRVRFEFAAMHAYESSRSILGLAYAFATQRLAQVKESAL